MRKLRRDNIVAIERIAATNVFSVLRESKHLAVNHCSHITFDKNEYNPCVLRRTLLCTFIIQIFLTTNCNRN